MATVVEIPLDGRRALVTGASRNLGSSIARELAGAGASVVVTYLSSEESARTLVSELKGSTGGDHAALLMDATDSDSVRSAVVEASSRLGGHVDILVNNAGPYGSTPFVEMDETEWDRVWDANVKATHLACQAAAPAMRAAGWGRIVNVSAVSAYVRNRSIYSLAKNAVVTLTETLALELAPEVTVNGVAPGQIAESVTDLMEFNPEWAEQVVEATPLHRLVTREEIARIVALLCSPPFDGVTGVTLPVDGGLRINRF